MKIWKKWIHWSRLKWNDGSKIEFEKKLHKSKKCRRKIFLIKIENKNEFFILLYSRKGKEMKKKNESKKEKKENWIDGPANR